MQRGRDHARMRASGRPRHVGSVRVDTMMQHKHKRAGRYVEAFSWPNSINEFLQRTIKEAPLLHVCSGPQSDFGDVRLDRYVHAIPPAVLADWCSLPFAPNSFAAIFADPPWNNASMQHTAEFCREAPRLSPTTYAISP